MWPTTYIIVYPGTYTGGFWWFNPLPPKSTMNTTEFFFVYVPECTYMLNMSARVGENRSHTTARSQLRTRKQAVFFRFRFRRWLWCKATRTSVTHTREKDNTTTVRVWKGMPKKIIVRRTKDVCRRERTKYTANTCYLCARISALNARVSIIIIYTIKPTTGTRRI